jgi:transcription antitermination factor NusG
MSLLDDQCWYAVQIRARHELQVGSALRSKGYETFVPAYKVIRRWSDRKKTVEQALFPTYAFCRFDRKVKATIIATPGVIGIVGFGNGPTPISDSEIGSLKIVSQSGVQCAPHPFVQVGQKVEVISGPLAGIKGIVVSAGRKNRIVISVELVHASAVVEVDEDVVRLQTGGPVLAA